MYGNFRFNTLKIEENVHTSATKKYIKKYFRRDIFNVLYRNRNLMLKFNYREKILNVTFSKRNYEISI